MDAVDRSPGLLAGVTMTAGLDPEPAAATHVNRLMGSGRLRTELVLAVGVVLR